LKWSLLAKIKEKDSDHALDFDSKPDKGKKIIDAEPSATIATTNIQTDKSNEIDEEEHLFHS